MDAFNDYTDILKEKLMLKKEMNSNYSMRAFARDLNIPASNLSLILKKRRGISLQTATNICKSLKLNKEETEHFIDKVLVSGKFSKEEKNIASKRIQSREETSSKQVLKTETFDVISNWYYFAILESAEVSDNQINIDTVSKRFGLDKKTSSKALKTLNKLGLLKKSGKNYLSTGAQLETTTDIPSTSIQKFNIQMLKKATQAVTEQDVTCRDLSTLTIAINDSDINFVKDEIKKFKNSLDTKLMKRAKKKGANKVYSFCSQFFSLEDKNE